MKALRKSSFFLRGQGGFTMIELAICLGIIAFALIAIIGVLPVGINVQKDNREETIINQDGMYWMEAIRSGAIGMNELTNHVVFIEIYKHTVFCKETPKVYSIWLRRKKKTEK